MWSRSRSIRKSSSSLSCQKRVCSYVARRWYLWVQGRGRHYESSLLQVQTALTGKEYNMMFLPKLFCLKINQLRLCTHNGSARMKTDATTRAHVKTTSGSMMEPKYTKKTWTCETNIHVLSDRDLQLQLACENEAFTLEGKNVHLCTSKWSYLFK